MSKPPSILSNSNTTSNVTGTTITSTLFVKNEMSLFGSDPTGQLSVDGSLDSVINLLKSYGLTSPYYTQQGSKLVGTGSVGNARQGISVAMYGDTLVVGGRNDDSNAGAVWVFTRTDGVWTQQGSKLVGTGAVGNAFQGTSVDVYEDTIVVGGSADNTSRGATWVFTRTNGVWTQQGSKLVGTGAVGNAAQGISVSIYGDTIVVGGSADNSAAGAAWVFTRTDGEWTQQGSKLVGTDAVGNAAQGTSVSIYEDTIVVGGASDNSLAGAIWTFTRTDSVWTQQGSKLVGTGAVGTTSRQGGSVSVDGDTLVVGGSTDNSNTGATWVFTRTNGVWTQQGSKLIGTDSIGTAFQGYSVAIYGDTIISGGAFDNSDVGAAWVFTRTDGVWTQQGSKLVGNGTLGTEIYQGTSVAMYEDTILSCGDGDNTGIGATWVFYLN